MTHDANSMTFLPLAIALAADLFLYRVAALFLATNPAVNIHHRGLA